MSHLVHELVHCCFVLSSRLLGYCCCLLAYAYAMNLALHTGAPYDYDFYYSMVIDSMRTSSCGRSFLSTGTFSIECTTSSPPTALPNTLDVSGAFTCHEPV